MTPGGAPPKARKILGALGSNNTPARKRLLNIKDFDGTSPQDRSFGSENSPTQSPIKAQPQLMTGDLASACAIM